jgi:hypothetical protein
VLQGKNIKPHRSLEEDLKLTDQAMSYDGSAARRATGEVRAMIADGQAPMANPKSDGADWPKLADGQPDFAKLTSAQRYAFDAARLKRRFG